ncbi:hypothetical protein CR513_61895, partial [Mucuna pruriens]
MIQLLATPPILTRPILSNPLLVYLSISDDIILHSLDKQYQKIEKAALTLIITSRRLRPYFQSNCVVIRTNFPIKQVLQNPSLAERMEGWTKGSGAGIILEGRDGVLIEQSLYFEFKANNNQAGCEALLAGMKLAGELGMQILTAKSDSKLLTSQVNRDYQARDPQLI